MKRINHFFLTLALLLLTAFSATAQDLTGKWWDEEHKGQTELYLSPNGKLYGKITMLSEAIDKETGKPALDKHNSDKKLRSRPTMGLVVVIGFVKNGDKWEGTVYNPKDGKTYSGYMQLQADGTLKLRGYVGISLIGKTEIWTRVK
ncbi:MAG: hypothetical protein RI894_1712 [Bacteroidota bacterium]|jgi:uncharacterized protein (DUF2147 family)